MSTRRRPAVAPLAADLLVVAERQRQTGDMHPVVERAELALRQLSGLDRARLVARQALSITILRNRLLAAGVATEEQVDELITGPDLLSAVLRT